MNEISPTLDVLYGRFVEAEDELTEADMHYSHVIHEHPGDADLEDQASGDLEDARANYRMASVLLEAREIQEGHAEWPNTVEARVYLAALRQIVAHLEEMTA
jgi:hypothetical protein